jgi:hypothetical protein
LGEDRGSEGADDGLSIPVVPVIVRLPETRDSLLFALDAESIRYDFSAKAMLELKALENTVLDSFDG